ncbi:MAG: acyl-CoA-binding protein [Deltaproteobacteria bacterium]|jgi:acyl-CoA-binding protein|nr:acyl-CoA-binding protein [Deltaproteobacteria bacterium]
MSDLPAGFEKAAVDVKGLSKQPDNDTLLALYAFHKQAKNGDVTGKRPGFTNMVGRAKYDAWTKLKGTGRDAAMQSYIDLVERLLKADK